ncbi:hypothetical protein Hanom_Chr16g01518781 [Helianthus anomalus]
MCTPCHHSQPRLHAMHRLQPPSVVGLKFETVLSVLAVSHRFSSHALISLLTHIRLSTLTCLRNQFNMIIGVGIKIFHQHTYYNLKAAFIKK